MLFKAFANVVYVSFFAYGILSWVHTYRHGMIGELTNRTAEDCYLAEMFTGNPWGNRQIDQTDDAELRGWSTDDELFAVASYMPGLEIAARLDTSYQVECI